MHNSLTGLFSLTPITLLHLLLNQQPPNESKVFLVNLHGPRLPTINSNQNTQTRYFWLSRIKIRQQRRRCILLRIPDVRNIVSPILPSRSSEQSFSRIEEDKSGKEPG